MTPHGWNITETAKHDSPAELEREPECPACDCSELVWDEEERFWLCPGCYREFNADLVEIERGEQ